VITNSSSEDIRNKGSSPCFCGALKKCKKAWSAKAKEFGGGCLGVVVAVRGIVSFFYVKTLLSISTSVGS